MELHLIRHPAPDVPTGLCYGHSDVGIREDLSQVAARLRPLLPSHYQLHASPLQRARRLAERLGAPRLDARLQEINFGAWEMRPFAELGDEIEAWSLDPFNFCPPGGESVREMHLRVQAWLDELRAGLPPDPVVVVAHGGPLRALTGSLLGLPPERWLALEFACSHTTRLDLHEWGCVLKWFNR